LRSRLCVGRIGNDGRAKRERSRGRCGRRCYGSRPENARDHHQFRHPPHITSIRAGDARASGVDGPWFAFAPEPVAPAEPRFRAGFIYDRSGGGVRIARRRLNKTTR
jgi:hypothetical protein